MLGIAGITVFFAVGLPVFLVMRRVSRGPAATDEDSAGPET